MPDPGIAADNATIHRIEAMGPRPALAVVLPFRDAARWLPDTLASLLHQRNLDGSVLNAELVAVDDGSTDGSAALVQELWRAHPWPLRLLRLPGAGVASARNWGWRNTAAPLVAFLDADDLCLPGRLAQQAQFLQRRPELAHCLCGWQLLTPDGVAFHEVQPWLEGAAFDLRQALRHKAVLPSAWMLRRQTLEAVGGFDPALSQAEDVDLLLRLAQAGHRGAWVEEIGCGYRVHSGGASRRTREQIRSLLWVTQRHLHRHSPLPEIPDLRREVAYTTRVWAGWHAWVGGEPDLALELWRTSMGLTPLPPALSWVHLAESAVLSSARAGHPLAGGELLRQPIWSQLEQEMADRLQQRPRASVMRSLRAQLLAELGPEPATSPWWPERLRGQLVADDPLRVLRDRVLGWCLRLLEEPAQAPDTDAREEVLATQLADLLLAWARLTWPEDPRPTARRLEQSLTLAPGRLALEALARLHRRPYPVGAAALDRLSLALPAGSYGQEEPVPPLAPAFWERTDGPPDRCQGPACGPCGQRLLAEWRRETVVEGCVRWHPPGAPVPAPPFQLHRLPGGRCWIRSPANPWGVTHGLGVATAAGVSLGHLCRRYPQPWPGCPLPPTGPEPPFCGEPLAVAGPVLAVADLSAEIHYHALLEALPRLGMALEQLRRQGSLGSLRVWHNGGGRLLEQGLWERLGLAPEQWIDAHRHPYIQAEELLVPDFSGPFGWPSGRALGWLRGFLGATAAPGGGRRLWLQRRSTWRRPVWNERATLEALAPLGVEVVDPAALPWTQQAALVAEASLLVVPHGAALANLAFAPPGARVLELHSRRYAPPYSHGLAWELGLELYRCEQPEAPPRLLQELLYEGPIFEPIVLDPEPIAAAVAAVVAADRRRTHP